MGIKGLWSLLTPYSEKKSLHEIQGEVVAVDLSGWVCDSQNVTDYHIQPKLYLRNLFFRTVYLLLANIKPIFVLEGDAPDLKRDVMAARNAIQFKGAAPRSNANANKKKPDVARKRFKNVLKECETLLKCMGVTCVKGKGEAEATCAQLNAQGLVNAVVSQDSDCFAYGAQRVYRNFSVSNAGGGGALQGSIDCYDVTTVYKELGFGRNKMIALAMLCGCDYGPGAVGSSIATAIAFLHTVPEHDVISRLLSWVSEPEVYAEMERASCVPGRCERCGHAGRNHARAGCGACLTSASCHDTRHKSKMADMKRELSLRKRALSCGAPFPEPLVMREFLQRAPESLNLGGLDGAPSLVQFVKLMTAKLDWTERYCVEKFLPLLTRWHLQDNVPLKTVKPLRIIKKRTPRGVPSFEVVWGDIADYYEGLVPDDQIEDDEDPSVVWTTIEKQDLMRKYYGDIVEAYEESIKKPPKEKKVRAKKKNEVDGEKPKRKYTRKPKNINKVDQGDKEDSRKVKKDESVNKSVVLNVSVMVKELKRKQGKGVKSKTNQKTIDSFVAKKRKSMNKLMRSLRDSFCNISLDDKYADHKDNAKIEENKNIVIPSYHRELSPIRLDSNLNKDFRKENMYESECSFRNEAIKDVYRNMSEPKYSFTKINDLSSECEILNECVPSVDKSLNKNKYTAVCPSENKENVCDIMEISDDSNLSNLSDIVNEIVNRKTVPKTAKVCNNLVRLVFSNKTSTPQKNILKDFSNCSTPNDSPVSNIEKRSKNTSVLKAKVRTSSFFDKFTDTPDAFEMSVDKVFEDDDDTCDKTVDYSVEIISH